MLREGIIGVPVATGHEETLKMPVSQKDRKQHRNSFFKESVVPSSFGWPLAPPAPKGLSDPISSVMSSCRRVGGSVGMRYPVWIV